MKSNEELINNLESLDADEYNFLIMTNKSSIPFVESLEMGLKDHLILVFLKQILHSH